MKNKILKEIISFRKKEKAEILSRFFKTGKGQYGFGDLFLGITVPKSREIAIRYMGISFSDVKSLINNKYHEVRLIALLILVQKYKKSKTNTEKKKIVNLYLSQTKYINNWDLVDLSAHYILGDYFYNNKKEIKIIRTLVKSKNLWEKRIAIISTFAFIYKGESKVTFETVKYLINDKHDLIHKACGWMLREVGKRVNEDQLCLFIDQNYAKMPRIMLRYAIERLPEQKRKYYLNLNKQ